jgi:hypothetical protein
MRLPLSCLFIVVQSLAQPVSYPLHVGNIWQYRNAAVTSGDTSLYSYKALSDTIIAGKTYTVTYFNNYPVSFERQSSDSVFRYQLGFGKEVLYFDFSRSPGDTVSTTAHESDTMDIVLLGTGLADYFGLSCRTWIFYVNRFRHVIDDEATVTVADGIGVVYHKPDFGDPMSLTGAVINGKLYGAVLSLPNAAQTKTDRFWLEPNFPNPFNPSTTIRFYLPKRSQASVEIYNSIGQFISQQYFSWMEAGVHDHHFDAGNLPSGAYFYHVKSDFGNARGRMLLIK